MSVVTDPSLKKMLVPTKSGASGRLIASNEMGRLAGTKL
jgi:hypothetical protein